MHARPNPWPEDILFITSNSLGDAILSTGLLSLLQARYPGGRFTVITGATPAPLFRLAPQVHKVIALRKRSWSRHWIDAWKELRHVRWKLIVDLRNTLVSRLLPARQRIVFKGSDAPVPKGHQLAGLVNVAPPPLPRLWLNDEVRAEAAGCLALAEGRSILALGPAANWPGKQWPAERFAALALALTGQDGVMPGATIVILATKQERDSLAPLYAALAHLPQGQVLDLAGRTDAALAAACLARASFFIGNDSGLMHMAAALGIPTLGLFGPSDDRIYGPHGEKTAFIRTAENYADLLARTDPGCRMLSLEVAEVKAAAERLYARASLSPS